MNNEILRFCMQKGLLLDEEILGLFNSIGDLESIKSIIEKISRSTTRKIITKSIFYESEGSEGRRFLSGFPAEKKEKLEKLSIKLGLGIEISKKTSESAENQDSRTGREEFPEKKPEEAALSDLRITCMAHSTGKKIEVGDFIDYYRNRFVSLRNILQEHPKLDNLVSINKITGSRQKISVIGVVSDKRVTKNKNIIFEIEDLTGKTRILINKDREELYKEAEEISLDSVIGFRGMGSREIIFANDVVFPDSRLLQRKKAPAEEYAVFIGDLHIGSKKFMKENFLKFVDYLNGRIPGTEKEVGKIKYLFLVGDLVTGIGNYPGQEMDLEVTDLEKQFIAAAELLKRIRKDIKIIISPGNHEGVRLMEPQPVYDEKYAWALYDMKNVFLTGNPSQINIAAGEDFPGFDVLAYHGFSFPYYADNVPRLMLEKAMNSPEKIMAYLLKNRHLAPVHASVQNFPSKEDVHIIKTVPDIFLAGHTHKSAVSYYNNILLISVSSWEEMTPYQEKFGNTPDHCKVPMLNLKTRAVKILDFE